MEYQMEYQTNSTAADALCRTIEQIIIALNNLIEKPSKTKTIGFNAGLCP
jgi:hypothetical protein